MALSSFLATTGKLRWPLSERMLVKLSRRVRDFEGLSAREVASLLGGFAQNKEHASEHVVGPVLVHLCD